MVPQEIERAAALAAERMKAMLIDMLAAGETGEVTVKVLSPYELKPVKRVETEGHTVKVKRGHSLLERA